MQKTSKTALFSSTKDEFKAIDKEIKNYIDDETDIALASPEPPMSALGTDVIVTDEYFEQRGTTLDKWIPHPPNAQNYNLK